MYIIDKFFDSIITCSRAANVAALPLVVTTRNVYVYDSMIHDSTIDLTIPVEAINFMNALSPNIEIDENHQNAPATATVVTNEPNEPTIIGATPVTIPIVHQNQAIHEPPLSTLDNNNPTTTESVQIAPNDQATASHSTHRYNLRPRKNKHSPDDLYSVHISIKEGISAFVNIIVTHLEQYRLRINASESGLAR